MLILISYGQLASLEEKKRGNIAQLKVIAEYLVNKMPPASFVEIAERQGTGGQSNEEQIRAINKELQPILANILVPEKEIKFGIYSRLNESIVAVGPNFHPSLLGWVNPDVFVDMYETQTIQIGEHKSSRVWSNVGVLTYRIPIKHNDFVIGHVFAMANMDAVYAEIWKRTIHAFLGGFIVLLFVILLFQKVLIRLKDDLNLFAQQLVNGCANKFESELPELTPIFKHISEQTENITRLNKLNTIGEMAAGIGHEVRNPMTTVRGYLQYMSNKEELKNYKEQLFLMMEEIDRANEIISEFLSLAKDHTMVFKKESLNKVILELAPLLQTDAMRSNCQIDIQLAAVPDILLDVRSVRQLILNMVRNAIEAMPQGGEVEIRTAHVRNSVFLVIKDQGAGIPLEVIERLGTPFLTTKENGTGLGLAICYRIVQRHGATISVESKPGIGTIFTIEFTCVD
jgi:signal transduction histidine kinase